jgi:hypothetical protein
VLTFELGQMLSKIEGVALGGALPKRRGNPQYGS